MALYRCSAGSAGATATVTAPTCANNQCSLDLPNAGALALSLSDIEDLSLVDDANLEGFNADSQTVMVDEGVTLIQSVTAGRQSGGTQLTFQTYGGWLDNSVFGVERIAITENGTTDIRLSGFSFGDAPGTNPSGTGRAICRGAFVGYWVQDDRHVQGISYVDIDDFNSPNVDFIVSGISDVNSASSIISGRFFDFQNMTLTDGTFTNSNGAVRGAFYRAGHTQIGGVVDHMGWIGAFGGTRQ